MENISNKYNTINYKLSTITPKHGNTLSANYNSIISSGQSSKKPTKTPSKTPLRLSSAKKKTPNTLTNDRYIPNRTASNLEQSYHLLVSGSDQENLNKKSSNDNVSDHFKRRLLSDANHTADKAKVLNLHSKQPEPDQVFADNMKLLYNSSLTNSAYKKTTIRHIQSTPDKILDAPAILNDFYLNPIDWSSTNNLAVALHRDLYIYNASSKEICNLFSIDENSQDYITSVSWIQKGHILAVGSFKNNAIDLWDINKKVCLRKMKSHKARVGVLSWNLHTLTSGSRSGEIHNHDVRVAQHHVNTVKLHSQEVCGLKWSPDGRYLASGANDNLVAIWDSTVTSSSEPQPLFTLREHNAAVKALAWCPWQNNILASGGGTSDRQIKIWNANNGTCQQSVDTETQVSSIMWSKAYKEIISSHGHGNPEFENQLVVWKYPDMQKVSELKGHTDRILSMAMSPDEETVVSAAADETLRFWKCFTVDEKLKKSKETSCDKLSSSQTSLGRCIR